MEIVGHVDDVIDGSSDSIDWECAEVLVRRWCCERHRMVLAQGFLHHDEELEVVETISSLAYGLTTNHNISGSRVFQTNIDPVNTLVLHVFGDFCSKGFAVVDNGFSNDVVSRTRSSKPSHLTTGCASCWAIFCNSPTVL
jgi:hypothetical protein